MPKKIIRFTDAILRIDEDTDIRFVSYQTEKNGCIRRVLEVENVTFIGDYNRLSRFETTTNIYIQVKDNGW